MRHHVAVQMEKERQDRIDNGPIVITADQLWRYSGKVEELSSDYILYDEAMIRELKADKAPITGRQAYYKAYWQKYKCKALKKLKK